MITISSLDIWKMTAKLTLSAKMCPKRATQIYWFTHAWKKKKKKKGGGGGVFFCSITHKARNTFRGLKWHVSGKRGWFCQNLLKFFRLKLIWKGSNLRQNPCSGGEFCILTKMCLGVYFKTFVNACVHLRIWAPPPPRDVHTPSSNLELLNNLLDLPVPYHNYGAYND